MPNKLNQPAHLTRQQRTHKFHSIGLISHALIAVLVSSSSVACAQTNPPTTHTSQGQTMSFKTQPLCIGFAQMDIPADALQFNPKNYNAFYNYHYFKNQEKVTPQQFDKQTNELAGIFKNRVFTPQEIKYNYDGYQDKFKFPQNNNDYADLGMKNALYQYTSYSPNKRLIIGTDHTSYGHPGTASYFSLYSQLFLYSPAAQRSVSTLQLEFISRLAPQRKEQMRPFVEQLEVFDGKPQTNQSCVGPVMVRNPDRYPEIEYGLGSALIQGMLTVKYNKPFEMSNQEVRRRFSALERQGGNGIKLVHEQSRTLGGMDGYELCYFLPKESDPDKEYFDTNQDRYQCHWWYPGVKDNFKLGSLSIELDIYKVLPENKSERSEADIMAIWNQLLDSVKIRDGVLNAYDIKTSSTQLKVGDPCPQTGFWKCEQLGGEQGLFLRKGDPMPGQSFNEKEQATMQWRLVKPMDNS